MVHALAGGVGGILRHARRGGSSELRSLSRPGPADSWPRPGCATKRSCRRARGCRAAIVVRATGAIRACTVASRAGRRCRFDASADESRTMRFLVQGHENVSGDVASTSARGGGWGPYRSTESSITVKATRPAQMTIGALAKAAGVGAQGRDPRDTSAAGCCPSRSIPWAGVRTRGAGSPHEVQAVEDRLVRWFVGTAIEIGMVAFTAAKLIR